MGFVAADAGSSILNRGELSGLHHGLASESSEIRHHLPPATGLNMHPHTSKNMSRAEANPTSNPNASHKHK
jgi:hypothetical protein